MDYILGSRKLKPEEYALITGYVSLTIFIVSFALFSSSSSFLDPMNLNYYSVYCCWISWTHQLFIKQIPFDGSVCWFEWKKKKKVEKWWTFGGFDYLNYLKLTGFPHLLAYIITLQAFRFSSSTVITPLLQFSALWVNNSEALFNTMKKNHQCFFLSFIKELRALLFIVLYL